MTKAIAASVSAALIGIFVSSFHHYLHHGLPYPFQEMSTPTPGQRSEEQYDTYFSQDYYEARDKFRHAVKKHSDMQLHSLKLDVKGEGGEGGEGDDSEDMNEKNNLDLTIDIGLLPRSKHKVLIHISGTHGVEGFVGSAIQTSLLLNDTMETQFFDHDQDDNDKASLPTIVFVHALNPFGFSKLRRFNENNVDLNRNFMTQRQLDDAKARDPNFLGYVDMMDFFNPTESLETTWDFFYVKAITAIVRNGFQTLKQCLVSGNYHFPKSLFYGGDKLEQSHSLLKEFLLTHLNVEQITAVGILDVHSGLGKSGFDTIGLSGVPQEETLQIFGGSDHLFVSDDPNTDTDDGSALSGYAKVTGMLPEGLTRQVFSSSGTKVYPVCQEFGTLPGILVFKAMRAENAMYQYDPTNRCPKYSQALRDAFYFDKNPEWKHKVISRGQEVFIQLYSHLKLVE